MKNQNELFEAVDPFRILLAEDDEDDFYFFNLAFTSLPGSFNLLRTSNGIMLSSLLQSPVQLDAIFLDINMPYKNGIHCLKEIRNNPTFNSTRVVMYTTSGNPKDIDACYSAGANFYIIKPYDFTSGVEQLKSLLGNCYFKTNQTPPRSNFVIELNSEISHHFTPTPIRQYLYR